MNDREKTLAVAVGLLVVLWGAFIGWGKYQAALEKNLNTQRNVAQELSTVRTATARGRSAQQKLSQWRRRSLPTDKEIAKSLYQDWLQQQLRSSGLQVKELNPTISPSGSRSYQQLSFTVVATGNLKQFTEFLYRFYQAKHLHRIAQADVKPSPADNSQAKPNSEKPASKTSGASTELTISLSVHALSLADGERKDQLAEGSSDILQQSLDYFREQIFQRNLFATYQSHEPSSAKVAETESKAKDSEAAQAKFSGINRGHDGWLMIISMQDSGKVFYYRVGDSIRIGQFQGTVDHLDGIGRRAILSRGEKRLQIRLGKTLADVEPLAELAS